MLKKLYQSGSVAAAVAIIFGSGFYKRKNLKKMGGGEEGTKAKREEGRKETGRERIKS